ncbi:MAG TPA: histidine phosphatase family protein [Solirubrobacteraceae bacterium]|jgi:probable phosphoglycerate mutase|nr:histidine phosphatase family protein [Solirubrobacteraceae bacterium]
MNEDRATLEVVPVRHAETEWSINGRHTGLTDIPLTEAGRATASALAGRLGEWRFERVLVSPLVRARETCELCGLGERAEICEDLHEWDYGDYEGLTTNEIRARRPDWDLWRDGCPGGESPEQVGARADRVLASVSALDGAVAAFSHGHMLRVLGARWIELPPAGGARLGLSAGAVGALGYERDTRVLRLWNDASARHVLE